MRILASLALTALVVSACGGTPAAAPSATIAPSVSPAAATKTSTVPAGPKLSAAKVQQLAALFDDQPFQGGQVAPRLSKWITADTFLFIQFDKFPAKDATEVRYVGVAQKGVFCAEAQPDAPGGKSFTHFHRPIAATYAEGHGGPPGAQGFWMTWLAIASFADPSGRKITPGVDYQFSVLMPPSCGANAPKSNLTVTGEKTMSKEDVLKWMAFFDDKVLTGGQTPPRLSKWLNEDVALFVQPDSTDPAKATTIRYVGIYERGVFCKSTQPTTDFTHYHRYVAPTYTDGHGGAPGETLGYWLMWLSAQIFESQGRKVAPGVDRLFSPTPPPDSC